MHSHILRDGGVIILFSYDLPVAVKAGTGNVYSVVARSKTTDNDILAFVREYGCECQHCIVSQDSLDWIIKNAKRVE
jgi:hypothetical protein